ncbi:MAG TPA: hypothetical protein VMV25_03885 [Steroidobacteraceae bacterium]|nr:hypothetical protein [Steroidobacteraceae bacterium]
MSSEVEDRIHNALKSHSLERIENGYRLVHPSGAGISTLRLLPVTGVRDAPQVAAIAEVVADYRAAGLPSFNPAGAQRLNAMAVYGAYDLRDGQLRQTAQFSLYYKESAAHLATQTILNAFAAQLPIGRSVALAAISSAALEQQRAHHAMPRDWKMPLKADELRSAAAALQKSGLAAANNDFAVWAELALSGDCPSRAIDPKAETALLQVQAGMLHPIAGAGYLASISLPFARTPLDSAELCRRLNALELEHVDFVPRLGAWGLHGADGLPGYHCFIPCAEPYGGMHMAMIWWCVRRAAWLRDRFWVAERGIVLDQEAEPEAG